MIELKYTLKQITNITLFGDILFTTGVKSHNVVYVGRGLASAEVAEFAHRVVVILGVGFQQQALGHVAVPHLGVVAEFFGKRYRVVNVGQSRVVGSENEFGAFLGVFYQS